LLNPINRTDVPPWAWRIADAVAIGGLIFFAFYYLTAFRFHDLFVGDDREIDFIQWYRFPPIITRHLQYPSVALNDWRYPFPYLPSAVAMFLPLSALAEPVAFGGWIVLQAAALAIVLWSGLKLSGAAQFRGRLLIALAAVLMTDNQIGWDFRTHNNNVIYLALIMLGLMSHATWLSGFLFGVSANLKIYSGFLVFGFIWRREYRLAVAMTIAAALIAVVLPIAVFGFSGYIQLLEGWYGQALYNPPAGQPAYLPANLLRQSGAVLLGAHPASVEVSILVRTSQAIWAALVMRYFILAARPTSCSAHDVQARLSDVCVVLLAPLPFSIWFTPYHAVVLLPANMLLLTVVLGNDRSLWTRRAAAAAMIGCQILQYTIVQWELRGATSLVSFVLILIALGMVRSSCPNALESRINEKAAR
jgi:hypothetical protein